MKTLPETFTQDGFKFTMLKRDGRVALLRKSKSELNTGYEVVIVQHRPAKVFKGRVFPEYESMPASEQWGSAGWTFVDRETAEARFASLTRLQNAPRS